MKYYFSLQYQIFIRRLKSLGIPPWAVLLFSIPLFIGLSEWIFYKTELAPYIYSTISLFALFSLVHEARLSFLRSIYNSSDYTLIRITESMFAGLPFIIFLLYKGAYWYAGGIFLTSIITIFYNGASIFIKAVPTPFGRHPFEFAVGFRRHLPFIAISYFLLFMGIKVNNFELSLFAMGVQAFLTVFFYNWIEPPYFVSIYSMTPVGFVKYKLGIALRQMCMLLLLPLILMNIFFPSYWWITILLMVIGLLYLATMIASKYSTYPKEVNLIQAILLGLALFFPPLLVILLPYYLAKAIKNLNSYLSS
ncbi:MAG: hypothetical protein HKN68_11900 [Saprospiraceae bacterium]|nr:hypothetical protein [Saprospiraceae bacterium]